MAIIQISRIQHRRGDYEDLPQLAGAEFGWAVDQRRLFIGNGTLEEGAPVIGNTEILTEFSDVLSLANKYTYRGADAGYVVQTNYVSGDDITRTIQSKLDETVSVRDFGAVGDGVADDTDAINRALVQLYAREVQTEAVRRILLFPAGLYRISSSLNIPPYAYLRGEGISASVVVMNEEDGSHLPMVRTMDSLEQTGAAIGANGAITPKDITITNLGFHANVPGTMFIIDRAANVHCVAVEFRGSLHPVDMTTADTTSCVELQSDGLLRPDNANFEHCRFSMMHHGIFANEAFSGLRVSNCQFDSLYRGITISDAVVLGITAAKISESTFDNIGTEAIYVGAASHNVSAFNMFYNVGKMYDDADNTPVYSVIQFQTDSNVSYGDMFSRTSANTHYVPIVSLNDSTSFSFQTSESIFLGKYRRESGRKSVVMPSTAAVIAAVPIQANDIAALSMDYTITTDTGLIRTGQLVVVNSASGPQWTDTFTESDDVGCSFTISITTAEIKVMPSIIQHYLSITLNTDALPTPRYINFSISSTNN